MQVEGEREGLLRDVIADCVDRLERDPGLNKDGRCLLLTPSSYFTTYLS